MMRLDATKSPYGPLHAIAAGAVLLYVMVAHPIMAAGFSTFWHQFIYGARVSPDIRTLTVMLASTAVVFGGVALLAWFSTLFVRRKDDVAEDAEFSARERKDGVLFALKAALPVTIATLAANLACSAAFEKLTGVKLADQPLVEFLSGGGGSLASKSIVVLLVVVEAPLLEEPVFRGIVFRGFARLMPMWGAIALSGLVFAIVHVNAATLLPLWLLGAAFAWLYAKTGTILAPMLVHFVFNLANLFLAFLLPGE